MGGCLSVSVSCDQVFNQVSQWLSVKESYIHRLEENLAALMTTMDELKARRDDLLRKVEREENKGQRRLAQVQVWLTRVATIEGQVNGLLNVRIAEFERLCFCGFCSKSFKLSYRYGKRVFIMLREVENLKSNGVFEVVSEEAQASEVVERPIQPTIVGREALLEAVWNHLMGKRVSSMGLYGMGGVGKTTLLTQINNKFLKKVNAFSIVIWILVSKDFHILDIQEEIAKKLGLDEKDWNQKDKDQKACGIHNVLKRKKFVLLLDDIWAKVNLTEIGVPYPDRENGCKVVFTTRSQEVCGRMGVDVEMEVKCLPSQDALDLFKKKVGESTLRSDPNILELAAIVTKKCCGLPLALNVIGEVMASKRTIQEWRHAVDVLTSYTAEFSGMKDEIFPILKYSYDNLNEEHVKSCLLYGALFPEDYKMTKSELIGYWICEGIIDTSESIEKAENKGYEIIGSLVRASLLMEDGYDSVRMHDVVRDMALWIESDLGIKKEISIVHTGVGLCEVPNNKNWKAVKRMSLINNKIVHLTGSPECLQLTTFLMQDNWLEDISSEFFKSMPKLLVLNLSGNRKLSKFSDGIPKLVSLRYLSLIKTGITHLPMVLLQELKELIYLELPRVTSIAGISRLRNLKVLLLTSPCDLGAVEELETLVYLEILYIVFADPLPLEKFLSSHKLMNCTRLLDVSNIGLESSGITLPETMDKLRYLYIRGCRISEVKMKKICNKSKTITPLHNPINICFSSLSSVFLRDCECLKELTFLMFAPNLKDLTILRGIHVQDIINKEKACGGEESEIVPLFPNLNLLELIGLPQLKNIYWCPLLFPCLMKISVFGCPNLKKIPLNSQSGKQGEDGLIIYYGEKEWIEGVEWEDVATKTRFLSSCREELFGQT